MPFKKSQKNLQKWSWSACCTVFS